MFINVTTNLDVNNLLFPQELFLGGNKIAVIPGDRFLPLVVMVMLDLRDNKIARSDLLHKL